MTPVRKNEIYTMDVTGMTHEGQGVGRIDNFTVFVDGALQGEKVEIKIIKVNKSYGVGKLLKIIETSEDRVDLLRLVPRMWWLQFAAYEL